MAHLLTDRTYYKKYINTKFNAAVDDTEKFSINYLAYLRNVIYQSISSTVQG